jgi:hypothetical protein
MGVAPTEAALVAAIDARLDECVKILIEHGAPVRCAHPWQCTWHTQLVTSFSPHKM